ncbi:HD family phosphohydrolase [Oceanobacillus bengalensis]|uniref:HD family phosphohydrolase n=1 Tax=Oceanobacillus bengalensis TaxID=1435466 RepID=A0A494Z5M3_9BACI|nr:HD family phosphohydrolase [Oceanobacillus bengalensis]RKQ17849.1 HD family phosphohydrolase [Oceanobacillus bengalensis]
MKKKKMQSLFKKRDSWLLILLSTIFVGIFIFLLTFNNVHTKTYNIDRFSMATETIRSPITIENEQETERKTRETVQSVVDRYNINNEITQEQINYINEIFEAISTVEEEANVEREKEDDDIVSPFTEEAIVERLKNILSENIVASVKNQTLIQLINIPKEDREAGRTVLIEAVEETLNNGVRTENIQTAIANVNEAIKFATLDEDFKSPLQDLSHFAVVENSFFDVEETSEARKEAASGVAPVMIRAGEVIVREGQTITNEIYNRLELVGVLDNEGNIYPLLGLGFLIILICLFMALELNTVKRKNNLDTRKLITIVSVTILSVSLMKIVSLFATDESKLYFIVPIATGALLLKLLIHERLAFIFAILFSILGSIIFNGEIAGALNSEAGTYFLFSQFASIFFLTNVKDRTAILKTGIGITVINIVTVLLFLLLSFEKYAFVDLLIYSSFAFASAFLSAVLAIGLLPFFETGLGILSDTKLLQLSNPNQPLLKKILTEAPGTYHHSVMVANLSETACESIGANGLLARVGAYYHDIGKTVKPHYFIENQLSIRNPHDFIDPKESAKIIINHPYDGAELLKKHKMPKEIIDIAKQHHGSTLLKYFYYKEKENNVNVKESDFRYPGPKPQTSEAAIICICDSVEAAVRSLKEPTEEKIEEIVASIISDRMTDGQLDESPLTLKELKRIQRTICETLKGIFHSRIQYPAKEEK